MFGKKKRTLEIITLILEDIYLIFNIILIY